MSLPKVSLNRAYSFSQVICTVGGLALSDYGADGGISFEAQSDELESKLSADGLVNYSANHDRRLRVTITVMAHSFAAQYLHAQYTIQKAALEGGQPMVPISFGFINPATKEGISSESVVFITVPSFSVEKTEGEREFVLELPYGRDQEVSAPATTMPS
jgi:hypothetical protein